MKKMYAVPEYLVDKKLSYIKLKLKEIKPEIAYRFEPVSLSDLAKAQRCMNFDCALPQAWVEHFEQITGFDPFGHFVYDYTNEPLFGSPYPVTVEGKVAYGIYQHMMKM